MDLKLLLCGQILSKNEAKTENCRVKGVTKKENDSITYLEAPDVPMIEPERFVLGFLIV